MNKGFFSKSEIATQHVPRTPRCGLCGLSKTCISPKMKPDGEGRKKILIVAEAPGRNEDEMNTPLVGKAGKRLKRTLKKLGVNLARDCWRTNAVICRPPENETPNSEKIEACRPNLLQTIKILDPNVIILLGGVAVESFLPTIWKEKTASVGKWAGFIIPCPKPNMWIAPTYHPSFLLRKPSPITDRLFEKHLRAAVKHKKKPWSVPPSYSEQIEVITIPTQAARILNQMRRKGGAFAFDYEANCLKPDGEGPEIISCSVCWRGKRTIAYPWAGEAIEATSKLLRSSAGKIASNIKFEERWTKAMLKHRVKNWLWDTMLAAHVLDNRPDITGLKFQAFIHLGMLPYDKHVKPYLTTKGKSRFNRIKELDLKELLLYNGLDSLLEYKIAMIQMKEFNKRRK